MSAASRDQYSHQRTPDVPVEWRSASLSRCSIYGSWCLQTSCIQSRYIIMYICFFCLCFSIHPCTLLILQFALNVQVCMQMSWGIERHSFSTECLVSMQPQSCREGFKGLLESPWETHGMRGSPNCGWQTWGHPEDEVQTDLRCILTDHQHALHPGHHLCLLIPCILLPHTNRTHYPSVFCQV